ncbi:MAG: hypothetical protein PHP30_10025 [Bacteroidales bacterium]|nr:hypothetical protein [Bacteroidales bacterium]MDD2426222.1 hypothetical protein [Bacteroidales bacterium]MDD3990412.1 hypothetical protein [Bacteroidales bacterium]
MNRVLRYLSAISLIFFLSTSFFPQSGTTLFAQSETIFTRGEGTLNFTNYEPLSEKPIKLFYYIPVKGDIMKMPVLFAMHGADRDASIQILIWREFAEENGFVVLAPEYSKEFYKENDYQFGGVYENGDPTVIKERKYWTYQTIEAIFDFFKENTGNLSEKYKMHGHSAGGQFVHRFLLTMPDARVQQAVASNPGSWTFPDPEGIIDSESKVHGWPYSVKDSPFSSDEALRSFFSKPLTIHLGTLDTATEGKNVPTDKGALAQGRNRFERGWSFYKGARRLAQSKQLPFNWNIVEVEGVGHAGRSIVYGKSEIIKGKRIFSTKNISKTGAFWILYGK